LALRLSEWLGLRVEKTQPLQAGGVPAMPDVGDRRNAGAPEVQIVGGARCATERENLLPANVCGPERRLQAGENKELQVLAKRWNARMPFARTLRPNVRAKLPAEAGFVSPVCDDSTTGADRAYKACRSGSA
jgi:hypothetical protein